jgi:hypothetical protein
MSAYPEEQTMYQKQNKIMGLPIAAAFAIGLLGMIIVNPLSAEEKMSFTIKSTAFTDGGGIPSKYTCEGKDVSPPLTWEGVPANTRSLVLIVDDPDAPDPKAPKMSTGSCITFLLMLPVCLKPEPFLLAQRKGSMTGKEPVTTAPVLRSAGTGISISCMPWIWF